MEREKRSVVKTHWRFPPFVWLRNYFETPTFEKMMDHALQKAPLFV
jgi:hypothetical protein